MTKTMQLGDEREAAALLKISARTLQAWRCRGGGPPYYKIGRSVRYDLSQLPEWASGRVFEHTTSAAAK